MKSAEQIIEFIAERIGYIYHHGSLMYGDTPDGVDLILVDYHELWAEIVERQQEYLDARRRAHQEEDCGTNSFASHYRNAHPEATNKEIAKYVVGQWRKISDRLRVPVPHDQIIQELEKTFGPKSSIE